MGEVAQGMATDAFAIALPMARTDGRTNERVSHHSETSSVTYRAGETGMFTHSDLDFATFVATRNATKVRKEAFVEAIAVTRCRMYDQETERKRAFIHTNERTAA
jgi:hypothetical protein